MLGAVDNEGMQGGVQNNSEQRGRADYRSLIGHIKDTELTKCGNTQIDKGEEVQENSKKKECSIIKNRNARKAEHNYV